MEKRKPMDITIGNNMANIRKEFNLTQKEICEVVGVNCSTYKHYELGDRAIPISVMQDLAKFYKVSTNYFFENMPDLNDKEYIEMRKYAGGLANSDNKYMALDISDKNAMKKYSESVEEKTQARARLRIKNLRATNNKMQKDIAKYLDIDISTYNKYEKGSRKLSVEVINKVAEYYNITVSDIID